MQRWEYLVAKWVGDDEPRVKYANGQELTRWEDTELHTYLGAIGKDGWELVGTMNRGASPQGFLVFKRPATS